MIRKVLIWSVVIIVVSVAYNKLFIEAPTSKSQKDKPAELDTSISMIDTTLASFENSATLTALKDIEVDKTKFNALLKNARKSKDEFEETYWIHDPTTTTYTNRKAVYIYLGQSGETTWLRFRLQYTASDWLFIENAIFNIDGQNFNYYPSKVDRDNSGGEIWEWWDQSITETDLPLLLAIANAKTAKVKLNGSTYYNVQSISEKERKAIYRVLSIYKGYLLGFK